MLNSPPVENTNGNGTPVTCRFGVFELDLRAGELRRCGSKVKLQEQPFQLLTALLEQPGQVITRDELRNRLWAANTYVDFDHSLNAAIRRLRDALGDSAENPTFVETVARRGYRFLAPVSEIPQNGQSVAVQAPRPIAVSATPGSHRRWLAGVALAVVLVLVGLVIGFHISQRVSTPGRTTRLTANPSGDPVLAAAISRDGRHLAFSDETGLYTRQIDTGETHPVKLPDGTSASCISWAPDNDHLILALDAPNQRTSLWELSVLGGNARKIVDRGFRPVISPNGKQVAFIAGEPLHQRIWLTGLSSEPPRELVGEDGDLFGTISWAPDSRKIAYTSAKFTYGYSTKGTIAVADVSDHSRPGGLARSETVLSQLGLDGPLLWAPDGRMIYTMNEQRPRQADSNLWSVRLNGQFKPAGAPVRLTNDAGDVFAVTASLDGKRFAYIKGAPQPDVYVAKIEPSGTVEEPQRLTLDDRSDLPYDWTIDNKNVIFVSDRTGSFSIYKQAIDQAVPELLATGNQQLVEARLSPDGTQIIYLLNPNWADENYDVPLMSMPLAGGSAHEIAKAKWISNHQCARAPATICLYSVVDENGLTFFRFDPLRGAGPQVFQLKDERPQLYNWTLSPDGSTLALAKSKWNNEDSRIHLVSLEGNPEQWLTLKDVSGIEFLDWAADSKNLWASTPGDKENVLLRIDLEGHAHAVWRPKNIRVAWAIPSRDGKHLALHVYSRSANVSMLEQ